MGVVYACGQSGEDSVLQARVSAPVTFDLSETGFHRSAVSAGLGERVEVSVEVSQEKDDRHVCGAPSIVDPFGNVLQELTPRQNAEQGTDSRYLYESRYAFFAATSGEYSVEFENRGCLLDEVGAIATVRWTVYPVQE